MERAGEQAGRQEHDAGGFDGQPVVDGRVTLLEMGDGTGCVLPPRSPVPLCARCRTRRTPGLTPHDHISWLLPSSSVDQNPVYQLREGERTSGNIVLAVL